MNERCMILRLGAVSAAVGALLLLLMALLPWPFVFTFPGEEVLSGRTALDYVEFERYVSTLKGIYICDTVFIVSWIIAWLGLFSFISSRNKILARVVFILGLTAASFDFAENMIVLSLVKAVQSNIPAQDNWLILWNVVNKLSYLLAFSAGALTAMCLQNRNWLERITSFIGVFFTIPAIMGLFVDTLFPLTYFWFFCWFICLSLLLWRQGAAHVSA